LAAHVKIVVPFRDEGEAQILFAEGVNVLDGAGCTVTKTEEIGEVQPGLPPLSTCKVSVLTEGVADVLIQLTVHGPTVLPGNGAMQPSQFQE